MRTRRVLCVMVREQIIEIHYGHNLMRSPHVLLCVCAPKWFVSTKLIWSKGCTRWEVHSTGAQTSQNERNKKAYKRAIRVIHSRCLAGCVCIYIHTHTMGLRIVCLSVPFVRRNYATVEHEHVFTHGRRRTFGVCAAHKESVSGEANQSHIYALVTFTSTHAWCWKRSSRITTMRK